MFHKVKAVNPLPDYRLSVQFAEGVTKIYADLQKKGLCKVVAFLTDA